MLHDRHRPHAGTRPRSSDAADLGRPAPGKQTLVEQAAPPAGATAAPSAAEVSVDRDGLTADQRSYYEAQRAADPTGDQAEAMKTARSSRPLTAEDREAVIAAQHKLASVKPRRIDSARNRHQVQIEITFDGTWNDRDEMAFDTNPALINDLFQGAKQYEKGVGTDPWTKLIGGATGAGISNRINEAYTNLVANINDAKHADPRAEVVLIITGFSRGSTAARAFANELNKRGVPDLASQRDDGSYAKSFEAPRIGVMILYDTVGSVGLPGNNINAGLDLSIPSNAENVLHLTARDEQRAMFPLSSAVDPARPGDPRITELALPGVHSDVGGSYPNRYSQIPLHMAHDYMTRAGVNVKPMASATPDVNDPALRLHDSGGRGERTVYPSANPQPYPVLTERRD